MRVGRTYSAVGVLALAALVVLSCESGTAPGDDNGEGEPQVGAIRVEVTADGSAESGVTVRLFAVGGSTPLEEAVTGGDGRATFPSLEAGSYEVEVEVPDGLELAEGETARRSVTAQAGLTATVSFALAGGGPGGEIVEVRLTSNWQFEPATVTISPGTTVRWINDDATASHTVTPRDHSEWSRATMTSVGQVFEHTFGDTGTFDYFCEPHESVGMTGSVVVQ